MNYIQPSLDVAGAVSTVPGTSDESLREVILDSRILVVDDQKIIRELLKAYLSGCGYRNLSFAEDGDEALEKIENDKPDLVILDLQMPRISGLQVCEAVRANPDLANLPILVQTAADSPEDRAKIFSVGATDMVGKPINDAELLARVGIHLQNRHMLRQLSVYRASMERELEAARRMQHDMMPREEMLRSFEERYPVRVRHHFQTCDALGGDIWSLWPATDETLCFSIVDFTGHGVVASLNTFRYQSLTMSLGHEIAEMGLQAVTERLNAKLRNLLPIGQFATALIGTIDFAHDTLRYTAAGGPSPFVLTPGAPDGTFCPSDGRPLGMTDDSRYPELEVPFPPGSSIFLYSDALTETPSMADPICDEERIRAVLSGAVTAGGETPFDNLLIDFFSRLSAPLNDDLTLLQITRRRTGDC